MLPLKRLNVVTLIKKELYKLDVITDHVSALSTKVNGIQSTTESIPDIKEKVDKIDVLADTVNIIQQNIMTLQNTLSEFIQKLQTKLDLD